ncbi:tyrosine-type recombinase/integrase [Microbacterium album]|uniref:Site-specific integrase n=1 Tax=Microbacterium album TaxID=2053191 RepID=A0A917IBV2_9MICO|nr:tyrosine-type recombinase/integrase [Microbacterium album]GGH33921.1 site-specific integrase [Microbacterium album]
MAGSISSYSTAKGRRYRVRYVKPDKSQTDKRGFKTKREAEVFLASVTVAKATGEYIDPALSRITVGQLAPVWLAGKKVLKPSSYDPLPRAWRNHVEPFWGHREIRSIVPSEVQAWLAGLASEKSASTSLRALGVLAGILDMAIADGRIKKNPARGLENRPKKPKKKAGRSYLSHQQLELLARCSARPTLVRVLGYTGLRWGEATALRARHVNQLKRRLHAEKNAVTVNGVVHEGELKSWEDRHVPYPAVLGAEIAALLDARRPNDLLFSNPDGGFLRRVENGTGWFEGAVSRAQKIDPTFPRITPHDLRHTAASLAVSAGANVKVLQLMLGHASAAETLDTYADLFDDDLESVAVKLDAAARAATFSPAWELALQTAG